MEVENLLDAACDILLYREFSEGLEGTLSLPLPEYLAKGGHCQFLTNLSLIITFGWLISRIFSDLARAKGYYAVVLGRMLGFAQTVLCCVEFVVCVTYWGMIILFPSLLNQGAFEVSWKLDIHLHLGPYVWLLIDYGIRGRKLANFKPRRTLGGLAVFLSLYWFYIEYLCWSNNDGITRYPYPFLNGHGFGVRLLWLLAFIALGSVNLKILELFSRADDYGDEKTGT